MLLLSDIFCKTIFSLHDGFHFLAIFIGIVPINVLASILVAFYVRSWLDVPTLAVLTTLAVTLPLLSSFSFFFIDIRFVVCFVCLCLLLCFLMLLFSYLGGLLCRGNHSPLLQTHSELAVLPQGNRHRGTRGQGGDGSPWHPLRCQSVILSSSLPFYIYNVDYRFYFYLRNLTFWFCRFLQLPWSEFDENMNELLISSAYTDFEIVCTSSCFLFLDSQIFLMVLGHIVVNSM